MLLQVLNFCGLAQKRKILYTQTKVLLACSILNITDWSSYSQVEIAKFNTCKMPKIVPVNNSHLKVALCINFIFQKWLLQSSPPRWSTEYELGSQPPAADGDQWTNERTERHGNVFQICDDVMGNRLPAGVCWPLWSTCSCQCTAASRCLKLREGGREGRRNDWGTRSH